MDHVRLGRLARLVRIHLDMTQDQVALRAGVSQSAVSRLERGLGGRLHVESVERICGALGIRMRIDATWRGIEGARLLDQEHAAIVEVTVRDLRRDGWQTLVEYTFNHYGERGSVDNVGWHAQTRCLLVVEVKSAIVDIQELLVSLNRKARLIPGLLDGERGWSARNVGRLLVLPGSHPVRDAIARHAATFAAVLPGRTFDAHRWLRRPNEPFSGVMIITESRLRTVRQGRGAIRRVRRRRAA